MSSQKPNSEFSRFCLPITPSRDSLDICIVSPDFGWKIRVYLFGFFFVKTSHTKCEIGNSSETGSSLWGHSLCRCLLNQLMMGLVSAAAAPPPPPHTGIFDQRYFHSTKVTILPWHARSERTKQFSSLCLGSPGDKIGKFDSREICQSLGEPTRDRENPLSVKKHLWTK